MRAFAESSDGSSHTGRGTCLLRENGGGLFWRCRTSFLRSLPQKTLLCSLNRPSSLSLQTLLMSFCILFQSLFRQPEGRIVHTVQASLSSGLRVLVSDLTGCPVALMMAEPIDVARPVTLPWKSVIEWKSSLHPRDSRSTLVVSSMQITDARREIRQFVLAVASSCRGGTDLNAL